MKKILLSLFTLTCMFSFAQTNPDLPITFDDPNINYDVVSFGSNSDTIVADPTDSTNMVLQQDKPASAQTWAGSVVGDGGLVNAIPFATGATTMSCRVWTAAAGTVIRMKVEDKTNGAISVETEDTTTMAGAWETLTFDFTNNSTGTPAIDFNATYDKVVVFGGFGSTGAAATYYYDDIMFGMPSTGAQVDLPITFDDPNVNYDLVSFGGASDTILVDPTDPANMVLRQNKEVGGQTWGGTVLGDGGLANAIPLATGSLLMSARVWSPDSGTPVLLKVEDAANGAVSVETFAYTSVAGGWSMLTFDLSNNAPGTPAFDPAATYDKVVIFCDFGNAGAGVDYYVDDVKFGSNIGIEENWTADFVMSPNPSKGLIRLEASLNVTTQMTINVVNVNGQVIYSNEVSGTQINEEIDLTNVASGFYLVTISSEYGTQVKKLIIED